MTRRIVALTGLVLALVLTAPSVLAYACDNNPGCECFNQNYRGGNDCVGRGDDCLTIICF